MHILLVEDHPLMQERVCEILSKRFQHVDVVDHGNLVLSRAQDLRPDAVVLDISLPGMSGLQLLPHLRKQHVAAAIVVLTTHASLLYQKEALARGADAYVTKEQASTRLLPALEDALVARRRARRDG